MTAELVKQTMCPETPTELGPELDKYLEKMVNQLRKVKRTQMPAEQLAAQKLLLDLPREKANELRAALRILKGIRNPTDEIEFDIEDLSKVIQEA